MAGARIVTDETVGRRERIKQVIEVGQGIVERNDFPAAGAEAVGELGEAAGGPAPDRLRRAGVQNDSTA